jgi:hypothetical protein
VIDQRTVIVGMNNPHSDDPRHALAPFPERVAGHRLWRMLADVDQDVSRMDYMRGFDRRNILVGREWNLREARLVSLGLWGSLEGRRALLLGRPVLDALSLPATAPLVWQRPEGFLLASPGPSAWCYVPHPSGLNQWYNDEMNRILVGLRLEEEYHRGCDAGGPGVGSTD